jgi:hypothetical protein
MMKLGNFVICYNRIINEICQPGDERPSVAVAAVLSHLTENGAL